MITMRRCTGPSMRLEAVQLGLMVDENCVWLEVKVEYGGSHDNTTVYAQVEKNGHPKAVEEQIGLEQGWPSGVIVQWEDVVRTVKHISNTRHTVLPLPAKNISYIDARCGRTWIQFQPGDQKPLVDGQHPMPAHLSLSSWEAHVSSLFLAHERAECNWVEISFHSDTTAALEKHDTHIGDKYYVLSGHGRALPVVPPSPGLIRDWKDITCLMRFFNLARHAELESRLISEAPQPAHEYLHLSTNHFSPRYRSRSTGLSLNAGCGRISTCLFTPRHVSSSTDPSPSVDFILKQVKRWADVDQDTGEDRSCSWIVVSFLNHTGLPTPTVLWEVYIQTNLGVDKGTPLPDGKSSLVLAELQSILEALNWSQDPDYGNLSEEPIENTVPSDSRYVNRTLLFGADSQLEKGSPSQDVLLKDAPPTSHVMLPQGDLAWLQREVPWHAYVVAVCGEQTHTLQPSFPFTSPSRYQRLDQWLSMIKNCFSLDRPPDFLDVGFFWQEVRNSKINLGPHHTLFVASKGWHSTLEQTGDLHRVPVVQWEDFVDGMKTMTWAPSPTLPPGRRAGGPACVANACQSLATKINCWMQQDVTLPFSLAGLFGFHAPSARTSTDAVSIIDATAQSLGMSRGWFVVVLSIFAVELVAVCLLLRIVRRRRAEAAAVEEGLATVVPKEDC
ncbi:hypothetical protein CALCODRAFT_521433 [Calocera cornea HHB12733]|uniref:Uncharacterized protein n=1 Tax=Calocera cornea HHB12733 TaxID=1353952 RepID=A0A165CSL2_9BASI|nr:hypothetical protein CALCODRAFT_521433 [Calocera cornea HHB12733]